MNILRKSAGVVLALTVFAGAFEGSAQAKGKKSPPPEPAPVAAAPAGPAVAPTPTYDAWKGPQPNTEFSFGALGGLGIVGTRAGFSLLGTASKRVVTGGWIPDISNSVSIEVEMGPTLMFGGYGTCFTYSTHLRWDFRHDEEWTLYTLGGLGGNFTPGQMGKEFLIYPRFGVGTFWQVNPTFSIRAELSHELIAVGVNFPM